MNISLIKTQGTEMSLNHFREVYFDAFPPDERRPWDDISDKIINGHDMFTAYTIFSDDAHAGFITSWQFPEMTYIEHFAVDNAFRQNGIGSAAIGSFLSNMQQPVVLEVELPGTGDMASRRIGFYRRHGFEPHPDFTYVQPPYTDGLQPVPMMLMTFGKVDLDKARHLLHHFVYKAI